MKTVYFTTLILAFFIFNSANIQARDISKIKLDSMQLIELKELDNDLEFRLLEFFDDMKRYINFNFPYLEAFDLEEITYMQKAINPLHYRHLSKYESKKSFFKLSSEKMYEFRTEAFEFWIINNEVEKTDIVIENIIDFNTLIFADAYLSKGTSIMDNQEYIDAEMFDDILFGRITRNDYINYLNFVIINSNQLLFKTNTHE